MKAQTKKTIIIVAAVAIIGFVAWWIFVYMKSPNGIVSRLSTSKENKDILRAYCKKVLSTVREDTIRLQAESDGLSYNAEVVDWALYKAVLDGKIDESEGAEIKKQIYTHLS